MRLKKQKDLSSVLLFPRRARLLHKPKTTQRGKINLLLQLDQREGVFPARQEL